LKPALGPILQQLDPIVKLDQTDPIVRFETRGKTLRSAAKVVEVVRN
jgi:hypothetical protein